LKIEGEAKGANISKQKNTTAMVKIIVSPIKREGILHVFIERSYKKKGTNGILYIDGVQQGYTIELPWQNNKHQVSCIPEGVYQLATRRSAKLGNHIQVMDVPERDLILIHPANNALAELEGCIAPVTALTGAGQGTQSRSAFESLRRKVYEALNMGDEVRLTIFCDKSLIKPGSNPYNK
jgi:hypothetical protein